LYIGNRLKTPNQTPTTIETLGGLLEKEGYSLFYASSKSNIFLRFIDMLWACVKYSRQVNYVFIDTYSTLNFYYAVAVAIACRILRLPYICILHGGNLENRLKNSPLLAKMMFKKASKLVAPSLFLKSVFQKYGYHKVHYLPNTLEMVNYPFKKREQPGPKLLWVRSFSRIYNPKLAVDVVCELKNTFTEVSLCMVGPEKDGALADTKRYAKQKGVVVTFTGKLSKTEWIRLAEAYDIFINTTNVDNMPVSIIEAMALGLPVVSTNVGGIPFLLADKKEAFLVPPNDPEAMATAIHALIEAPEVAMEIAKNARAKAELFDWKVVRSQWIKILQHGV
jgi:glycosyltransferase involved in cell wall biosynthesis